MENSIEHDYLDLRFENERVVVLVECKDDFSKWDKDKIQKQLQDYVKYEKKYTNKKIVAILSETMGNNIWVWYGKSVIISEDNRIIEEKHIKTIEEYENLYFGKVNDKIKVVDSIKVLNEMLHSDGIVENLRSQFVGTCLLTLKNGLIYENIKEKINPETGNMMSKEQVILYDIKEILKGLKKSGMDENSLKISKIAIINDNILTNQSVMNLTYYELRKILEYIDINIVPYINDKNTAGQDLLNLFFITFNKYVGKSDKN